MLHQTQAWDSMSMVECWEHPSHEDLGGLMQCSATQCQGWVKDEATQQRTILFDLSDAAA